MERIIFYYESIKPDRTAARNNPTIKNSVINTRNNKVHVLNSKGKSTSISANGNMIIDKNKGITNIEYNHLNLPKKIEFASDNPMGSNKINYTFDATGVKLAKSVIDNAGFYTATTTTQYAGNYIYEKLPGQNCQTCPPSNYELKFISPDAASLRSPTTITTQYAGNYIYENNTLKFFSQPEGYIEPTTTGFDYVYQYKDHLGNVRLSYSDMNKDGIVAPPNWTTVFSDGFESASGWDGSSASWGHSVTEFDQDRVHEGSYSARIYAPQGQSRVAHSNEWVSISNSEPTEYRYSGWAYSESPVIRLGLAMKKDGETGYLTLFDDIRLYNPLNEWVYVEKYVTVPAHITSVNLRLECAAWGSKVGNVWWDDVKIEVVSGGSEIVEESNYYPFGLKHKGYNNVINGTHHPYGFGGKEENDELGLEWLDFGARNYDPALGRWMNLDPLAEDMRRHSPYNYAFNNPLRFIDPDGMAPEDIILDKNLTKEQRADIMSNLQKLTDDTLSFNSETNKVEISSTNDSGDKSSGTGLIRALVNHDKDVTITADSNQVGSSEEGVNKN